MKKEKKNDYIPFGTHRVENARFNKINTHYYMCFKNFAYICRKFQNKY